MSPFDAAVNAEMRRLAELPNVMFYGQSIRYDGAAIFNSLDGVPMDRRVEMPVAEELQMGFCIGRSLTGVLPVCIFPRIDFMLLAMNQFVNHLDKLPLFGWHPKVIIRTTVGKKSPLDAGPQHTQNPTEALKMMLRRVSVWEITEADQVPHVYNYARECPYPTLIVENPR